MVFQTEKHWRSKLEIIKYFAKMNKDVKSNNTIYRVRNFLYDIKVRLKLLIPSYLIHIYIHVAVREGGKLRHIRRSIEYKNY